jgi:archaemetzincin
MKPERFSHLLGIIDEDIFIPELNFVFGVADMIGDAAIISLSRLRQEFYGLSPDRDLFLTRAAKEAIHEIGHTCGLVHCTDPLCIMYFSNSLVDTDKKGPDFCPYCKKRLLRTAGSLEKEHR